MQIKEIKETKETESNGIKYPETNCIPVFLRKCHIAIMP